MKWTWRWVKKLNSLHVNWHENNHGAQHLSMRECDVIRIYRHELPVLLRLVISEHWEPFGILANWIYDSLPLLTSTVARVKVACEGRPLECLIIITALAIASPAEYIYLPPLCHMMYPISRRASWPHVINPSDSSLRWTCRNPHQTISAVPPRSVCYWRSKHNKNDGNVEEIQPTLFASCEQ